MARLAVLILTLLAFSCAEPSTAQAGGAEAKGAAPAGESSVDALQAVAAAPPRLVVQTGHSGAIYAVGFSPDGTLAFSGGEDNTARLWELTTGRELLTLVHRQEVRLASFTPDSRRLITCSYSGSGVGGSVITLWDAASGGRLEELPVDFVCRSLEVSPDGGLFATGDENKGLVLLLSGQVPFLRPGPDQDKVPVAPSPRELFNKVEEGRSFILKPTGRPAGGGSPVFRGHSDLIYHVALSPDRNFVLSGGNDRSVRLWEAATGRELRVLRGEIDSLYTVAVSQDGERIATGCRDGAFNLWEAGRGSRSQGGRLHDDIVYRAAFSPKGDLLYLSGPDSAVAWSIPEAKVIASYPGEAMALALDREGTVLASGGSDETVRFFDLTSGQLLWQARHHGWVLSLAVTKTGVLVGSDTAPVVLLDRNNGAVLQKFAGPQDNPVSVAVSPDGSTVGAGFLSSGSIMLWDSRSGQLKGELKAPDFATQLTFSPDGSRLAAALQDSSIRVYEVATGKEVGVLRSGHSGAVYSVAFSPDARVIWSAGYDKTLIAWDLTTGTWLAKLFSFTDRSWAVVDPQGRFDTNNLEEIRGLHWVMPDDPLRPLPLEIFMRDYYEPRLLVKLLKGEKLPALPDLTALNRVQPAVQVASVHREAGGDTVTVVVEVSKTAREFVRAAKKVTVSSDAHDLKLFRDGQLVGFQPGRIEFSEGVGTKRIIFSEVRLPRKEPVQEVKFSAYAFNDDGVKSKTASASYAYPADLKPLPGKVYLVAIGVNLYQNNDWNLRYATADARRIRETLEAGIPKTGAYRELVAITLTDELATKANIRAVLARLAGEGATGAATDVIANLDRLDKATPEDLLIVSFSGHGYVNEHGIFYAFSHDTGASSGKVVTPALLEHVISSDELSLWLRRVDAGEMAMVVDACHSAASVGSEFKAGPMGSRGLGQLAYDKGMRILAASQADDLALESDKLEQGLLTYALVRDGIEAFQADFKPKDRAITLGEWLAYGVERVPGLAQEVRAGHVQNFGRGDASRAVVRWGDPKQTGKHSIQTPALFDFTGGLRDVELARTLPEGKDSGKDSKASIKPK